MTKLFLAAGVAALAISAPANASPGGQGHAANQNRVDRAKGGGDKESRATRVASNKERAARPARAERQSARVERSQVRTDHAAAARTDRVANRSNRVEARVDRSQQRVDNRVARIDNRTANRVERINERMVNRSNRIAARGFANGFSNAKGRGLIDGCPPGLAKKNNGCLPPGQAAKLGMTPMVTARTVQLMRAARVDGLNRRLGYNLVAPVTAASLIGLPLSQANSIIPLSNVPDSIRYLYPSTSAYDYRYGNGYMYQVDRSSNLISSLLPL
ncbi:MAG: hypothetical protein ABIO29_02785, partial [Sphingomicrobium sp.]